MSEQVSKSDHTFALAKELLDDIECSRITTESLILKATRLARLTGSEEMQAWLRCEMIGYHTDDPIAIKYMGWTGRWTDINKQLGFWAPLAQIQAEIEARKIELQQLRMPNLSSEGGWLNISVNNILNRANALSGQIAQLSGVTSRVLALLHDCVANEYYARVFSHYAEDIFARYKTHVDARLASICGDALKRIPVIYERLAEGDGEAVSQAMNSCRRLIDYFADEVYPAREESMTIDGSEVQLGQKHVQNRVNAYIAERTVSKTRRKRLRQALSNIYDRVSTGIHNEVSVDEAKALVLGTYLFLGEVLALPQPEPRLAAVPESSNEPAR